jgi:hypothetical protein
MQICCRFPENNRPPIQEILDWFTYLLFIPEEDGLLSNNKENSQHLDCFPPDISLSLFLETNSLQLPLGEVESPEINCFPLIETNDVEVINLGNIIEKDNLEIANTSNLQEVIFQDFDPDLHNIISVFSQHEEIIPITETSHVDLHVSCFLQSDFKEQFQGSILKDDSKLVFNEESISRVAINLINDLTSKEIELVSSNDDHEQWEENEKDMIYELYSFIETSKFTT